MNLSEMRNEELLGLIENAKKELVNRNENYVVYEHDCSNASKHHFRKYKHWAKIVRYVGTTKSNGYAFIGEFLSVKERQKIPAPAIVVEMCDPSLKAYKYNKEGDCEEIVSMRKCNYIEFIEEVARYV